MKLTQWFPASVKPVRVGVYSRKSWCGPFSYWNGIHWCEGIGDGYYFSEESAEESKGYKSRDQTSKWRGLAHDPLKGKK